ncbi:conserved membrane hypothetical protein [Burkholderia latens]|uniref:hypothetical protein n=1 Tax=Burkholderia latens TaxID=488446 RepID=UPI0039A67B86
MSNVIPFRRGKAASPEAATESQREAVRAAASILRGAGVGAAKFIRYAAFLLLLWLRRPVRFMLMIVAFPALLAFGLMWAGLSGHTGNKAQMMAAIGGIGFAAFALSWLYDTILLRLAPHPIFLT